MIQIGCDSVYEYDHDLRNCVWNQHTPQGTTVVEKLWHLFV